jgi:hypothetical protein
MIRRSSPDRSLLIHLLGLAVALGLLGCAGSKDCGCDPDSEPQELLYSSSFEADADTVGWTAHGTTWIAEDAPPGGGSRALGVGGGCVIPHAVYTLGPGKVDGYYTITCWAREVYGPGGIVLGVAGADDEETICLEVTGGDWMPYHAAGYIRCAAGQSLAIEITSGALVSGGIHVDLLEVLRARCD